MASDGAIGWSQARQRRTGRGVPGPDTWVAGDQFAMFLM
jgi:hypothetical protein